jgi:glycosyltransferase involved in cell wall biosynthesis
MKNPLISIIIPTYNRAHLIIDTLDSIFLQTHTNWECIIVDDGSTDNTKEVVHNYINKDIRFQFYQRPKAKQKGANACRNHGLDIATGEFIVFFDSDDVFSKTALENRIDSFKNNDVDMVITSMGLFSDVKNLLIDPKRVVFNESLKDSIEEFIIGGKLPWNICRPTFKSKLIKGKIYFNEDLLRFQDIDFNIRVLQILKPRYLSIDVTDCYYRNDIRSRERYHDKKFIDTVFASFYILYSTVFSFLDSSEKERLQKGIVLKLFVFIKAFCRKQNKRKSIKKIIKLLKKELKISASQQIALYGIYLLNTYYYKKKGYFKLSKIIRNMIHE